MRLDHIGEHALSAITVVGALLAAAFLVASVAVPPLLS